MHPDLPKAFLDLPAPAKINLFLHIVGIREDDYHLLESVFLLISLADSVSLTERAEGGLVRTGDMADNPSDLCLRAARLLQEKTGCRKGAEICVTKRIPSGAGLGGGSSDAATTLIGLNRLWDLGVSREELAAWGTELGADVPFFIQGENAFVEGIGERITPIPVPAHDFLIVYPGAFSATDRAFRDFDLTTPPLSPKISGLSCLYQDKAFHFGFGHNDLQPVVTQSTPAVRQAIQMLSPFGSVRMTGSGSAVFLPLQSGSDAKRVLENLPEGWSGYAVKSLERHPLSDWFRSGTGS